MKKCYIAIIGDEETGRVIGTVMVKGWRWYSPYDMFTQLSDGLTNGIIMDFKRIK